MEAAELVTNVNANNFVDTDIAGGEIRVGFNPTGGTVGELVAPRSGHYLTIVQSGTDAGAVLKPLDAARIDRKVDDGDPTTGSAGAGLADCIDGGEYDEATPDAVCTIAVRIQG